MIISHRERPMRKKQEQLVRLVCLISGRGAKLWAVCWTLMIRPILRRKTLVLCMVRMCISMVRPVLTGTILLWQIRWGRTWLHWILPWKPLMILPWNRLQRTERLLLIRKEMVLLVHLRRRIPRIPQDMAWSWLKRNLRQKLVRIRR